MADRTTTHTLCGAQHPTTPLLTCGLAANPWPHQHVAHRPGPEPYEQRAVTWFDPAPQAATDGRPVCPDFDWCTHAEHPGEHADFHASDELSSCDVGGSDGFWTMWLVRPREADETSLVIETEIGGRVFEAQLSAYGAAVLLAVLSEFQGAEDQARRLLEQVKGR